MDYNSLKSQIVEEVKQSLSHYIEERVDELLRAFFAPLFVQKPEKDGFTEGSTQVSSLQSSKSSSVSGDNTPAQTSDELKTAALLTEQNDCSDDRSSSAASSRLSVLDKPSSALDFSGIVKNGRQYYLPIYSAMPKMKPLFVTFNSPTQGLLYIISQYRRQFCRVIPGFRALYRQFVAYYNLHDPIVFEGHSPLDQILELQNLLFDYLCSWIKSENYLGQEKRSSGIRHMWKCNHPGEERVLVVGLSFDMFDSPVRKNDEDVCQIINAFFVKKVDVNPSIINPETTDGENATVKCDNFEKEQSITFRDSLKKPFICDSEIKKATLRVLLNGADPTGLCRNSPFFGKTILPIGKHQIAKHDVRIMFNNVNQGILHLLIVCFDRFRRILPEFESLPLEVSTKRDVLRVAGNISRNFDLTGENALIYLQCLVYSFLHSSMISDKYLGYENRTFGTRHIWSLPKSFEGDFVLALTMIDEIVIEGNKCYYKVDTASFLPLSHLKSFKIIKPSALTAKL
uniref:Uncharacterized protein n=1 Tax=Panagrolaimus sp. ES5 TaxID=591445 RepID=A0AC34F818_9BILA